MDIKIRRASIEDLEKVRDLNHKLFEFEYENFDPTLRVGWSHDEVGEKYFRYLITEGVVFLACDGEKVVGYLSGSICKSSYTVLKLSELNDMFIDEQYRSSGVGTMLMNEFKKYSLENEIDSIKVTATAKNKNAIDFYMKHGFEDWNITLKCDLK